MIGAVGLIGLAMKRIETLLLKSQIDRGEREPVHNDIETVCIYLLQRRGWDYTFKWVRETYSDNFLPEDTKEQLERIISEQNLTVEIPTE
jgi:hypothetical protein